MIRFLFVGDLHASDSPPAKRDEHYREDILVKLREIVAISKKSQCDSVIFAGDIFHQKQPRKTSHKLVLDLMEIFTSFGCPVYICVGNHDITEGRLESLEKQPLGVLGRLANVTLMPSPWDNPDNPTIELGGVSLHSVPGIPNVTVEDYGFAVDETKKWNVLVSHQSIVPEKTKLPPMLRDKDFMHDSQEVADVCGCDVILYGHEHSNHGVYKRNEKLFVNVGSVCRGTIGESDLKKEPSVFLLELGDTVRGKVIKLQNVRPIEECYLLEEHFAKVGYDEEITRAVERLKDTRLEVFSIEAVIGEIEVRHDVEQEVKEAALSLLETVR